MEMEESFQKKVTKKIDSRFKNMTKIKVQKLLQKSSNELLIRTLNK